jgi:hypothetical protein
MNMRAPTAPESVLTGSGAQPASYPMGTGGFTLGLKRQGHEAYHSPPSIGKIRSGWTKPPLPQYNVMACILKPVSEPGYFVASWWRTPWRHPPKLLLTNRFYFQQTSGIHAPVGKRKGGSLSGRSPAPIADSSNVATIARKHRVLNLREINRNNTRTALASVLTYYGWVSLIF